MGSGMIVVGHAFLDPSVQLPTSQNQQVIQTLSTKTPHEAFATGIRFWGAERCANHLDTTANGHLLELDSILAIIVTDQEPRAFAKWGCFSELLRHLFGVRTTRTDGGCKLVETFNWHQRLLE